MARMQNMCGSIGSIGGSWQARVDLGLLWRTPVNKLNRFSLRGALLSIALMVCANIYLSSAAAATEVKRSLRDWAVCNGTTDDTGNFKKALTAAKNSAFTIVVDCPVRLKIGNDITHSIFIDNGTTVEFTSGGKFTIDNVMIPAFVIANSHDITLTNWNVEYDAGLPISGDVGGYVQNSQFYSAGGSVQPAGAFSEFVLTRWLAANRGVTFKSTYSFWRGGIVPMAVLVLSGDSSEVNVTGMHLYVPPGAGGNRFIPVAFGFWPNYKSNQTVFASTPIDSAHIGVPHDMTFSDVVLDGTYFGWLGNAQHVLFENITSHRYGDLQDAKGQHVGGTRKWFAPPHLFYLNYDLDKDSSLFNTDLQIRNVVDDGPRVGVARDKGGSDTFSGYANSLKLGCIDCIVDNYASSRPDGLLDVLPSTNVVFSNITATYDSEFLHQLYPAWRFPTRGYKELTFENISVTDIAASSSRGPIGDATSTTSEDIVFSNVSQTINHWATAGYPLPTILGSNNHVAVKFSVTDSGSAGSGLQLGAPRVALKATPSTVKTGEAIKLAWKSEEASSCSASGAWSGSLHTQDSRVVTMPNTAGTRQFTVRCQNSHQAYSTSVNVLVE